jgi:hypothetical protein
MFPPKMWRADDLDTWLGAVERSAFSGVARQLDRPTWMGSALPPRDVHVVGTTAPDWAAVEGTAGDVWRALRPSIASAYAVRLPSGNVQISLASGIVADIDVHAWPRGANARATARLSCDEKMCVLTTEHDTGRRIRSDRESVRLPDRFEVTGRAVTASVTLRVNHIPGA